MIPWVVLGLLALVFEVWGYLDGRRVVTLSRVVWWLDARWVWIRWAVLAFFVALWIHWFVG